MRCKKAMGYVLCLCVLACAALPGLAEVEPPRGEFEYYTGKYGWHAVVLCEELSVREGPSLEAGAGTPFAYGTEFTTTEQQGEWRNVLELRDGSKFGWVRAEYVLVDPAYFITEEQTPVYAYDGADSPRVALLEAGERLPVIKETETGYIVSLRGASGFIRK